MFDYVQLKDFFLSKMKRNNVKRERLSCGYQSKFMSCSVLVRHDYAIIHLNTTSASWNRTNHLMWCELLLTVAFISVYRSIHSHKTMNLKRFCCWLNLILWSKWLTERERNVNLLFRYSFRTMLKTYADAMRRTFGSFEPLDSTRLKIDNQVSFEHDCDRSNVHNNDCR